MNKESIISTYFNNGLISQLSEICDNLDIPDNNKRADTMMKILKYEGFSEVGCGTNRLVVTREDGDTPSCYVFKIALDNRGVVDNNVEHKIAQVLASKKVVTENYENIGIISVAEKIEVMTSFDMDEHESEVASVLQTLNNYYVLNDVGPKSFMNWGTDKEGYIKILDSAYLCPISEVNFNSCKKCGGNLAYTKDLTGLECTECGKFYSFGEVTGGAADVAEELGFETTYVKDENKNGLLEDFEFEKADEESYIEDLGFIKD